MTTAMGYIYSLESKIWHGVESLAVSYPNQVRWLAIAMAIGTCIKDVLFPLVKCVENTILAVKRYSDYSKEIDQGRKQEFNQIFNSHIAEAYKNLIKIPFSPFVGICRGVYSLICILSDPLVTAKIGAAKADLEAHFEADMTPHDLGLAFAKEAVLERFSTRLKSLDKLEDIAAVHFMHTEEEKAAVIQEVHVKREKYNEYIQATKDRPINRLAIQAAAAFEIDLRNADLDRAKAMQFEIVNEVPDLDPHLLKV